MFIFAVDLPIKMDKNWTLKKLPDTELVKELSEHLNLELPLAALLAQRGISTVEEAFNFFNPDMEGLHDPFLMYDMDKAIERLSKAILNNEKILVYGDYDVDGATSVALMYSFLCEIIGKDCRNFIEYYIPDRHKEGYGLSELGIKYCADNNFTLMITLDCGIKAVEKVGLAKSHGIDVIICDHHLQGDVLPNAVAILNPKCHRCNYPYKDLSGCGVGFKLIQAYCQYFQLPDELWLSKIDFVAISIASDMVPITGENRILTYFGLDFINKVPRLGIRSILEQTNIKLRLPIKKDTIFSRKISVSDLVFIIGPRINAAGRVHSAREAVKLLICEDEKLSLDIGKQINEHNNTRRELDKKATEEAVQDVLKDIYSKEKKSVIVYNPGWSKGIIGIVASRLVEEFYKPVIVFTDSNDGMITGSARSVKEFNIYDGIDHNSHLLEHFGGHRFAAGLTLRKENFDEFVCNFEKFVVENLQEENFLPEIVADVEIKLTDITPQFVSNLKKFAPFGPENMSPIFWTNNVVEEGNAKITGFNHLKLNVLYRETSSRPIDAIAFNQGNCLKKIKESQSGFDILYHVEENTWNNNTSIQLNIKDIKVNPQDQ